MDGYNFDVFLFLVLFMNLVQHWYNFSQSEKEITQDPPDVAR